MYVFPGVALIALAIAVATAGFASAGGRHDDSDRAVATKATERFRDVEKALLAHFIPSDFPGIPGRAECFSSPEGGMGIHFINDDYLGDGVIDAAKPEALVYEPTKNHMKLVALEYVIPVAQSPSPPSLFGTTFMLNDGVQLGTPPLWTLHAWIYEKNPLGFNYPWNPNVSCNGEPEHHHHH
jgi:hypothetical protein